MTGAMLYMYLLALLLLLIVVISSEQVAACTVTSDFVCLEYSVCLPGRQMRS